MLIGGVTLFTACDDGEIPVSEFEFEASDLEFCYTEATDETVFYNANDTDEILYVVIDGEFSGLEELIEEDAIDANVVYNKYTDEVSSDAIFCNAVSTTYPISRSLIGVTGSTTITTSVVVDQDVEDDDNDDDGDNDLDNDGISNVEEGYNTTGDELLDTDQDSIPNYLDEDDDNDNVPTSDELDGDDLPIDTDGDGIFDHLDPDDDNDGILTRYEVNPENTDPTSTNNSTDDGVCFYLDENATDVVYEHIVEIDNSYETFYQTNVNFLNLELSNSGETVTYNIINLGTMTLSDTTDYTIRIGTDNKVTVVLKQDNIVDEIIIFETAEEENL